MQAEQMKSATLLLDDGTFFHGRSVGAIGTTTGEIAFNTGMTGYQEIFTDPSYFGQLLVMTTAHIGNYGVHAEEVESSSIKIAGAIIKKFSEVHSRTSAETSLQKYFERDGLVGIADIDTRALVRHIRDAGAMNAIISSETSDLEVLKAKLAKVPSMDGLELSSKVATKEAFTFGEENADFRVAVLDLGVKNNILRCLAERGCFLKVFPLDAGFDEIMQFEPDGIMLSNGPGDPSAMTTTIELTKRLINTNIACFGICLGHQIIALSQGLTTTKMFNGHRGVNHPVKNLLTGKCETTSQNHGFVVSKDALESVPHVEVTHIHLNDDTVAGIRSKSGNFFSVQFHPEASAGPHDSRYLFDDFVKLIEKTKAKAIAHKEL
jgi:carbamoyl-phosphate synthase small subunit